MWSCEQERENEQWNDSLTEGQRAVGACREFAANAGADRPDEEWLLTDRDTWERNPHFQGEAGQHPLEAAEDWGQDL